MATLNVPYTFSNGSTANATEVNSNFTAVKTFVESNTVQTDGSVKATIASLATEVINRLVPVGTIMAYAGVSAPTGWLLCDGTTSTTGYPTLAALVGATTPNFKGRFPIGDDASLTLLGVGGSASISVSNLPAHTHSGTTDTSGLHSHPYQQNETPVGTAAGLDFSSLVIGATTYNTGAAGAHSHPFTTSSTGGSTPYYPPFLVVNFIIKHD